MQSLLQWMLSRTMAAALISLVLTGCTLITVTSDPYVKAENVWARPSSASMRNQADTGMQGTASGGTANSTMGGTAMGGASSNAMMGPTSAIYMVLTNRGKKPDALVAVRSDVAEKVELHQTKIENDVMRMEPVEFIEVPAEGQVELKRGGLHIMLLGVKQELVAGSTFKVVLVMKEAGEIPIEVEVRNP